MKKQRPEELITLKIDKVTHSRIKQHCIDNDYYMHLFVEEIVNDFLDKKQNIKKNNEN
jgi:hypothetical protein